MVLKGFHKKYVRPIFRRVNHHKSRWFDRKDKVLILTYHRILPVQDNQSFLNMVVPFQVFQKQIQCISKQWPIISFNDLKQQQRDGKSKAPLQVLLSFDDGYYDHFEYVFPWLKEHNIPATFFVCTDAIGEKYPLWDWYLYEKLKGRFTERQIQNFIFKYKKLMASERHKKILMEFGINVYHAFEQERCMSWDEIRIMAKGGMTLGSHGCSHSSLAGTSFRISVQEIQESKIKIEENIGQKCGVFAFPYGARDDFNNTLLEVVYRAGYEGCFSNIHGYNHFLMGDRLIFNRVIMTSNTDVRYLLG